MKKKNKQITLYDIIEDITKVNLCECCKAPSENNIHEECADTWWNEIVMQPFKEEES